MDRDRIPGTVPRKSATFDDYTLSEIRRAAAEEAGTEVEPDFIPIEKFYKSCQEIEDGKKRNEV